MPNTFFTSDTHFGDDRVRDLSRRPFSSLYDMDRTMIRNWNNVVGKDDTVYHLGDFGAYEVAEELHGHIILLFGNYEWRDMENGVMTSSLFQQAGFSSTIDWQPASLYNAPDKDIWMCHEPSHRSEVGFNLFGHIHSLQKVKRNGLNVGVDCHNFTPISLNEVLWWKHAIENFYNDEVFMQ